MEADKTVDLMATLKDVKQEAVRARKAIALGVEKGLPVNGTTALRNIEVAADDALVRTLGEDDHAY